MLRTVLLVAALTLTPGFILACQESVADSGGNRIESVFSRGSFESTLPMKRWIEATYGKGRIVRGENTPTRMFFSLEGHSAWLCFTFDESVNPDDTGVTEYLLSSIPPQSLAVVESIGIPDLPSLSGVFLGEVWSDHPGAKKFKYFGAEELHGAKVLVYEAWPFGLSDGTLHRVFVAGDEVVGLSISVPE